MPGVVMLYFLLLNKMFQSNHLQNYFFILIKGFHLLNNGVLVIAEGAGADEGHGATGQGAGKGAGVMGAEQYQ